MAELHLPVNIFRARRALGRLRDSLAAGRQIAPTRGEVYLIQQEPDPVFRAAVAARYAGHTFSEGPGQNDRGLTRMTPDPIWYPSHDRTSSQVIRDDEAPSPEVLGLLVVSQMGRKRGHLFTGRPGNDPACDVRGCGLPLMDDVHKVPGNGYTGPPTAPHPLGWLGG